MKVESKDLLLYLVTDRTWLKDESLAEVVEEAIKNGVTFVQVREKDIDYNEFKKLAIEIKEVTDKYKIPFVVNDNIELAVEVDADGVHIGQGDIRVEKAREIIGKDKILGVSVSNIEQAIEAQEKGADYLGTGAIFPTQTKPEAGTIELGRFKDIRNSVDIPVVAIGGVSHENIYLLQDSKMDGVAVVSAILAKEDIGKATKELKDEVKKYLGGK